MSGRSNRSAAVRAALGTLVVAVSVLQPGFATSVLADPASPISVTKSATPNPVASGAQLTYTIRVENLGGAKLDNVVMTDQVNGVGTIQQPPGLPQLTITSTKGSCVQGGPNGNAVTCNAGTMAGREIWTVTIRGQVTASNGTVLNNTASVTGTKSAQTFNTNGSVSVLVQGGTGGGSPHPDLTINKTGPTSIGPNAPMTYTLTINNVGTANTSDVHVVDTLPAGVGLNSITTTSLFVCTPLPAALPIPPGGATPITVDCTGGSINQGQNATITINGTSPVGPATLTNTAVVDPDNDIEESNELNNASAAVNTAVGGPPPGPLLSIAKTDDPNAYPWSAGAGPDPVNPGQELVYKIQVKNLATTRADDVIVSDGTQGLDASSIIASQVVANGTIGTFGGCVVNAPQVRCQIKSLNPGGTLTVTIRGIVIATAGSTLFNTATVNGNIKNVGVTNTDAEETTVRPAVDLSITKADSPDPACARTWPVGDANVGNHLPNPPDGLAPAFGTPTALLAAPVCLGGLTYTFVIGNSGIGVATPVTVRDPLPAGLIFDSYSTDGGFACAVNASNVVTCTGGSVPAAQTRFIKFRLVAPPNVGPITNTVKVDPNNAIFEPDETNNDASATTNITTGIDLTVWKGDRKGQAVPGDGAPDLDEGFDPIATSGTGTYTVIVDNLGTQDSTGIKVVDTLPAGTKFLSVTSDQGFTCSHDGSSTGGQVTCVGGHLHGTAFEFYEEAGAPPPAPLGDEFATIKIKFVATAFVQPSMHNEVRVDPDNTIAEVNELNNLAIDNTKVETGNDDEGAFNQLTIDKSQFSPVGPVATNGVLAYDLLVSNEGTDPVSNVVVKDFLPAGSRFISAADLAVGSAQFFCSHDGAAFGGTVTCTGGDLSGSLNTIPGVPTFRTIRVIVFAPNAPGQYINLATVDPDNVVPEGNEFDNDDSVTTTVSIAGGNQFIDLTITKTASPGLLPAQHATPGGDIVYTIVVTNGGTDPAFDVKVVDTLPAGTTFVSADDITPPAGPDTDPNDFTCTFGSGTVTCTGATLDGSSGLAGEPTSRTLEIRVRAPLQTGIRLTNQVRVDPDNTIPESSEINNSASARTDVKSDIDLTLTKTGPKKATQNQTTNYTIQVKNEGDAPAENVKVVDYLPIGLIPLQSVQATPGNFACQVQENPVNLVTCVGDLNEKGDAFDHVTITVPVFITADGGVLDNQACVDPDDTIVEFNEFNNCAENTTPVVATAPDLHISKSVDKASISGGEDLTYTVTVSNNGDADADGPVTVTDTMPANATFVNANPDAAFTCSAPVGDVLSCSAAAGLTQGQSANIVIQMTVDSPLPPNVTSIQNLATVDPATCSSLGCEAESSNVDRLDDNSATATSTVGGSAIDLVMVNGTTFDAPDPVVAGHTLTYTLNVTNAGSASTSTDPAPNLVVVRATLPAGLDLDSAAASNGFICIPAGPDTGPVGNVDCSGTLAAGDSTIVTITTTVTASAGTMLTVTAAVDPDDDILESNEGNNDKTAITSVVAAPCTGCIDLVAGSIPASPPDPVLNNTDVTYNFAVTNVGDTSTNGDPAPNDIVVTIDLDTTFNESTPVSASAPGFTCVITSPPTTVFDPEIECTNTTGFGAGEGAIFSVVAHVNTASTTPPTNYVDFDVVVDPGTPDQIEEFNPFNNTSTLRVHTHS